MRRPVMRVSACMAGRLRHHLAAVVVEQVAGMDVLGGVSRSGCMRCCCGRWRLCRAATRALTTRVAWLSHGSHMPRANGWHRALTGAADGASAGAVALWHRGTVAPEPQLVRWPCPRGEAAFKRAGWRSGCFTSLVESTAARPLLASHRPLPATGQCHATALFSVVSDSMVGDRMVRQLSSARQCC